jgi:endonuclease/exonuclease/phosphatase family metal-dependent hydrolase
MIRIFALFLLFVADIFALRIGTYNVENLFDDIRQGGEYREYIPGNNHGWTSAMAKKKLSNIAYAISEMDVDVVGIQEIENRSLLADLANKTGFAYYDFAGSKGAPSGVGLLSKYPIKFSKSITASQPKIRPSLHVKLDVNGDLLDIIVVHWPSLKNSNDFRESAAKMIDKVMSGISEGIVMGDFNDPISPESVASKAWAPLETYSGWFDAWMDTYPRWSHDFFGDKKALDRMLLSEGLFDGVGLDYVCGSFGALYEKPFLKDGIPHRWEITNRGKGKHIGKGYSDHLPLVLELSKEPFTCRAKKVQIDELFKEESNQSNFEISKVVVLYAHEHGMILGDRSGSIHVFEPGFSKPIGTVMDVHVNAMGEFFGMREIRSLHVSRLYEKKVSIDEYLLPFSKLKNARAGDVISHVKGVVRKNKLDTEYGSIELHVKPNFPKPKEGQRLSLERVRVGEYRGRVQLILEERE